MKKGTQTAFTVCVPLGFPLALAIFTCTIITYDHCIWKKNNRDLMMCPFGNHFL